MNRTFKHKNFCIRRTVCAVLLAIFFIAVLSSCTPKDKNYYNDGVVTKQPLSGEDATGSLETEPVGTWRADLPFYRLGFTQISNLRTDDFSETIDGISASVRVELVFGENGEFFCLADRNAVLSAISEFGAGFLDVLDEADTETMAKMKNMSVGDFENFLSVHGKTKEDFAVEVSESLMKFVDKKNALFEGYDGYGNDGLCIVYKGAYALRGGRLYVGKTKAAVFDNGSIIAEMNGSKLHILSDTDLHFFSDCEFERVN